MPRVAIIGAGSVEFTRNVVADLCSFPELAGQVTIALHDINAERLAYAERAAASIVRRTGAGHRVEASAERRPAVDGADYVINEIQVGGYRHTLMDFEIPKKYGVRQTIGDTIGIGGIFRGLRTIPVAVGIGNDLHELAPDALLLNYTNPMAMVPWAVYEGTPFANVFGVCHSVRDTHAFLARTVGVPERDVAFRTAGFNHQCFVLLFRHRGTGEDLYPRLREVIEADPEGLGHRVQRALERVRPLVPPPRRPGRAVPVRDRRVPAPQRGESAGLGADEGGPGRRPGARGRARLRAGLGDHPLARDRHRA